MRFCAQSLILGHNWETSGKNSSSVFYCACVHWNRKESHAGVLQNQKQKRVAGLLSTLPPSGNRCSLQVDMLPEIPMVCQYIEWFVVISPSPNGWITWLVVHPIKVTLTCFILVQHVMTWKKGPGPSLTSVDIWSAHYTNKLKLLRT